MTLPKRQHVVPEMLLHRFADSGRLFYFSKKAIEKGVMEATPKTLFVHRHIYSLMDDQGGKDAGLERAFAREEQVADRIITKITDAIRLNNLPKLSVTEKKTGIYLSSINGGASPTCTRRYIRVLGMTVPSKNPYRSFKRATARSAIRRKLGWLIPPPWNGFDTTPRFKQFKRARTGSKRYSRAEVSDLQSFPIPRKAS